MGNWNISIRGIGPHNNENNPTDADRMARRFVREMKEAGHSIIGAEITHGGATPFVDPIYDNQKPLLDGREDQPAQPDPKPTV